VDATKKALRSATGKGEIYKSQFFLKSGHLKVKYKENKRKTAISFE